MLETEICLQGKITIPISLKGQLNEIIKYIEPNTQETTVKPTTEEIVLEPDKGYVGFSKVTVEKVDNTIDNNITPENIKENVNILGVTGTLKDKKLGTKEITTNGTYNALDDELDGYSSVNVATSGVDINDYFLTDLGTNQYGGTLKIEQYIKKLPNINLDKSVKTLSFANMVNLEEAPFLDTNQITSMNVCFMNDCKLKTIPQYDTSNVTNFSSMFYINPYAGGQKPTNFELQYIPELDFGSATNINYMFRELYGLSYPNLTTVDGFKDLGKAYSTTASENNTNYKLDVSYCKNLTEQSLINILNDLYDIASLGVKTQQVVLGSTNLAKLTSPEGQEALANAQTKGWTIS